MITGRDTVRNEVGLVKINWTCSIILSLLWRSFHFNRNLTFSCIESVPYILISIKKLSKINIFQLWVVYLRFIDPRNKQRVEWRSFFYRNESAFCSQNNLHTFILVISIISGNRSCVVLNYAKGPNKISEYVEFQIGKSELVFPFYYLCSVSMLHCPILWSYYIDCSYFSFISVPSLSNH